MGYIHSEHRLLDLPLVWVSYRSRCSYLVAKCKLCSWIIRWLESAVDNYAMNISITIVIPTPATQPIKTQLSVLCNLSTDYMYGLHNGYLYISQHQDYNWLCAKHKEENLTRGERSLWLLEVVQPWMLCTCGTFVLFSPLKCHIGLFLNQYQQLPKKVFINTKLRKEKPNIPDELKIWQ